MIMSLTKQYLLEAIETAPDEVLEELLGFLRTRLPHRASPNRRVALAELQKICQEENYTLVLPDRQDRVNSFLEEV
jgi:hypothetical protein